MLCSSPFVLVAPFLWPCSCPFVRIFWPSGLAPLFLSVRACCAYSLALRAGALCSYPLGLLGWRPLFLSVCACRAYSLALWAGALRSYPFLAVCALSVCACCAFSLALWAGPAGPILFCLRLFWHSGLAPSDPVRLCLLRLFSGPLGWRLPFLSFFCCLRLISLCLLRLFSGFLGWPRWSYPFVLAPVLALWAGVLCSYPFVLVAPILWPSGLATSPSICLCLLRLFSGPLGWRALFLSVCACFAYSLAL